MAALANTIITRSSTQILSYLSAISSTYKDQILLYAISTNAPNLEHLVSRLSSVSSESIGCLSSPLLPQSDESLFSCSLALFRKETCKTFRSTLAGQQAVQVGRWHAFRKTSEQTKVDSEQYLAENVDWEGLWSRNGNSGPLPSEIDELSDVHSFIYFTDGAHQGISSALETKYPHATKLGLVSSSTPFLTGSPYTLLRNGEVHTSGAVGVALTEVRPSRSLLRFPGLVPLALPMKVTRCEGNLVHELDNSNPSKLLLSAIQDNKLTGSMMKEENFYIGILEAHTELNDHPKQVYRINSGDPSRGSIALETDAALEKGLSVQFYYRPGSKTVGIPPEAISSSGITLGFLTNPIDASYLVPPSNVPDTGNRNDARIIENLFIASSENGFLFTDPGAFRLKEGNSRAAWQCTVPGAFGALKWL